MKTRQPAVVNVPFDKTNPAHQYLSSLMSKTSHRTAASTLQIFAEFNGYTSYHAYPWRMMRAEDLKLFAQDQSARNLSPNTINTRLSILKRVSKESLLIGLIEVQDFERIKAIKRVQGFTELSGRMVDEMEFKALVKSAKSRATKNQPAALRDVAILCVARFGGLRRTEIALLDLSDCIWDRLAVKVKGKARKHREQPLPEFVMDLIADWIDVRGEHDGPLFTRMRRGGVNTKDRLSDQGIYHIVTTIQERTGLSSVKPHDLRRTYCTSLLDAGNDLSLVSDLMGHADLSTTKIYDRRKDTAKADVAHAQANILE